ncbi:hypothetical protein Nepgr_026662 [Nepenthes gracilis]|uniref:Uncharacterized protein n=1 Tax=Nepenthes gracilis TaxID=150966 RepID=A0AAD3T8S5_NEPGR|nr:hypothetical protein Nepgr_026662 [Nepenthes gracilis]
MSTPSEACKTTNHHFMYEGYSSTPCQTQENRTNTHHKVTELTSGGTLYTSKKSNHHQQQPFNTICSTHHKKRLKVHPVGFCTSLHRRLQAATGSSAGRRIRPSAPRPMDEQKRTLLNQ